MKKGILSRNAGSLFPYQAWPTVVSADDGTLFAVSSSYRISHMCPFGKNCLFSSHDGGNTWVAPTVINDTVGDDRDAGLVMDGDTMYLSFFHNDRSLYTDHEPWVMYVTPKEKQPMVHEAIEYLKTLPHEGLTAQSYLCVSSDRGLTWSAPRPAPVTSPHGPLINPDGSLLWVGKVLGQQCEPDGTICACLSRDKGESWTVLGTVPLPAPLDESNFHEPHAIRISDNEILCALRVELQDADPSFTVYLSRSTDNGVTWETAYPTGFNGSPPHLFLHSGGALILSYTNRTEGMFGSRVRISRDGGRTFGNEIILSSDCSVDNGYPSTAEKADGTLITVYYGHFEDDVFTSLLYTQWSLDDEK